MATGESRLQLVIEGNSDSASKALQEISKMISSMAESASKMESAFSKIGETVSKSIQDILKSASSLTNVGKDFDGATKGAGDLTKAMNSTAKAVAQQTSAMNKDFESLAKVTEDSAIGIVGEIDKMDRTIKDMGKVMADVTSQMAKDMSGLRSDFAKFNDNFSASAKQAEKDGYKISKAIDYGSLLVGGQQLQATGDKMVGFFAESVKAAAEFSQALANTRAALDAQPGAIKTTNDQMLTMQKLFLQAGSSGFYSANQVAEAASTLARNGLKFNTITQGAIQQTAQVAAANTQNIDDTAMTISDIFNELGGNIVKQFHGNVTAAFRYLGDVMTETLHSSKISAQDLFSTIIFGCR